MSHTEESSKYILYSPISPIFSIHSVDCILYTVNCIVYTVKYNLLLCPFFAKDICFKDTGWGAPLNLLLTLRCDEIYSPK